MTQKERPIRVLILDDEAPIRESLASYLEDTNLRVQTAGNAEEALEKLTHCAYDIAIVDVRLPGMDGENFILEAHRICPRLKYILHTGTVNYELSPAMRAIGMRPDVVLLKPVARLTRFTDTIRQLLED
ncbi:MAG: response regulator [Proteobacteria bacterium]|nr:response regulator [Pseudomonadota bacterium]